MYQTGLGVLSSTGMTSLEECRAWRFLVSSESLYTIHSIHLLSARLEILILDLYIDLLHYPTFSSSEFKLGLT